MASIGAACCLLPIHPCSARSISSLTPHPSIPPSPRRTDMPAALSAWVCLALNVTAACHLLLLPPRGSLPTAAHSRASNTGQSDAGSEGDPRVDLGGGFCAAGLSVAGAVLWPLMQSTAGVSITLCISLPPPPHPSLPPFVSPSNSPHHKLQPSPSSSLRMRYPSPLCLSVALLLSASLPL
ncbi:unnamed protein product [Closterium sp. Naga37s-1]|nr:unnamed protein product [Closterium sp. Naga37s-1]